LIAELDGVEIGAAWYRRYATLPAGLPPYELSVALKLDYTRLGIGPELMRRLMHHAKTSGIAVMGLQVHVNNRAARKAYDRLGFIPVPQAQADETGYIPMVASTDDFADVA
jgi:RimJ/RimL family protein N-acetyltransferase